MKKNVRVHQLEIGSVPRVVGVVSDRETLDRTACDEELSRKADLVEVRVDLMACDGDGLRQGIDRIRGRGIPVLLTVRHASEGGHWRGDEASRMALLEDLLGDVDIVDIEVRSGIAGDVVTQAHERGLPVILSAHDFSAVPSAGTLDGWMEGAAALNGDLLKVAATVNDEAGLGRLLALAGRSELPVCVLAMGDQALDHRLALVRAGSCLTYGYLGASNAPGQPSSESLKRALEELS